MGIKMLRIPGPGKNLFDKNSPTMSIVGRVESDWTIVRGGTSGGTIIVPVEAGTTYTMQFTHADSDTNVVGRFCYYSEYPSSASVVGFSGGSRGKGTSPYTFTAPANAKYFAWWASRSTSDNVQYCLDSIQIEKGTTATPYEPYMDYVYYPGVQAYEGGMVDMGTLNWVLNTSAGNIGFVVKAPTDFIGNSMNIYTKAYTTGATVRNSWATAFGEGDKIISLVFHSNLNDFYVRDDAKNTMTAEQFKAAMSGKYLYYQRSTDSEWRKPYFGFLTGGN